jgi:hypothetical protein
VLDIHHLEVGVEGGEVEGHVDAQVLDFDHLDRVAAQLPGQAGAIRAGAFNPVGAGNSVRP